MYGPIFEGFAMFGVAVAIGICGALLFILVKDFIYEVKRRRYIKKTAEWLGRWGA